ncbi:MAG: adenylate/guanylate cyclase domain-containing protein [Mycobacteriales bacterium]|nr:adenylate/guanylate cyclase domain-containing protein [Mycobacteriales bacterium]
MTDGPDGAARRALAGVRQVDRQAGAVGVVRRLRRALPGDPGFGDPLSAAGTDSAATIARLADRLFDEQPRVSREIGLGALQVWQSLLERTGRGRGDRELTIAFTDLAGFSTWAERAGDDAALRLLRQVASAVEPAVLSHRGQVVKRLGDGVMAVFPTPALAFDAVVMARARVAALEVDGHRPRLRAGLHTGLPRRLGDDYLGVDVNIAARLVEKAGPEEVLVSNTALAGLDPQRVATRVKKTFLLTRVKGVPDDLKVYVATPRDPAP